MQNGKQFFLQSPGKFFFGSPGKFGNDTRRKHVCPLQPSIATWPLQPMARECINNSFWFSIRGIILWFIMMGNQNHAVANQNDIFMPFFFAMGCNGQVAMDGCHGKVSF
jgi:hypothetical protein